MFPMLKYADKYLVKHMQNTPHKRKLYYQHNFSSKIEILVNKQIQEEQQAAQEYLNMAVTFLHPSKALVGAGGFFMKMYEEELQHMRELIHYQILRGGHIVICGLIPPIEHKNLTLIDAMKQSLAMEKSITKQIEECIKVAEELQDYQCADFLTTVFLAEQMLSIHEMAIHVKKLSPFYDNEEIIYHYDLKLAKKYPYSYFKTK